MTERVSIPKSTRIAQAVASDPQRSVWVSANAGSGKTYILAQRVIRLLLGGVAPDRILCLTFTKAAAAEMSKRVFDILAQWTRMEDSQLREELVLISDGEPDQTLLKRARTLFALSLDAPGGLKIQTIHAFCEALLHQFPLEAELPGHFQVIEDDVQRQLIESARRNVLSGLDGTGSGAANGGLRTALARLLDTAPDQAIAEALAELIAMREEFSRWVSIRGDRPLAALRGKLGFRGGEDERDVIRDAVARSTLGSPIMRELAQEAARFGQITNERFAEKQAAFCEDAPVDERLHLRNGLFLTRTETPRKAVTDKFLERYPDFRSHLEREGQLALDSVRRLREIRIVEASEALFLIGRAILARYEARKRQRGLSDFDDLIQATVKLLIRDDIRGWVRYKLDRGIDHVLIDEAQDTSPAQWEIINALIDEFFAGEGARTANRTVFAVGDEKQSIYSFQGADPREFLRQATDLERKARNAALDFDHVKLHHSFRSGSEILEAVDLVFKNRDHARGLGGADTCVAHEAIRTSPGEVQIWPLFAKQKTEEPTSWLAPVDAVSGNDPALDLARRIAATVAGWVGRGERLPGAERPMRCGDILILVRRRDRFVNAVIREMKTAGLAIAGADRLVLTEHIAVEDLIALGRFALMREDDLSLAALLKSPLLGFDDDMLTAIASERNGMRLIDHLHRLASRAGYPHREAVAAALERLECWCRRARNMPPFEFFSLVLGGDGARKAFLARLGNEVDDILDAFLQTAIHHERAGGLNLEGFIAALCASPPEIRRETDTRRDEVRVMTVHAAKGLEAPVVFLVDPCTPAFMAAHRPKILRVEGGDGTDEFLWQANAAAAIPLTEAAIEKARIAAEEEYRRLLYVAMTRAKDRLVVCGWHGIQKPPQPHWHAMVQSALSPGTEAFDGPNGGSSLVWRRKGVTQAFGRTGGGPEPGRGEPLPCWLASPAPSEPGRAVFLTPSGAGELDRKAGTGASVGEIATAREEGIAVHRLLQYLPDVEPSARREKAFRFLERNHPDWPAQLRDELAGQAVDVVGNPALGLLFGPRSSAEIPLAGTIALGNRSIRLSGQIDRLADLGDRVLVADFKSGRNIPGNPEDVPPGHVAQMALYREAIRQVFPGKTVECVVIWTRSNVCHPLADQAMDRALSNLSSESGEPS